MGKTTIEWCDFTFNHVRGCTKVAEGCKFCYADTLSKRNPGTLGIWGPNGTRVVASEAMWREPLKWNKKAMVWPLHCELCRRWGVDPIAEWQKRDNGHLPDPSLLSRPRVFCASLADVFEDWGKHIQVNDFTDLRICTDDGQWVRKNGAFTNVRLANLNDVRRRLFSLIDATPNLDWLLLTKRPENIRAMWPDWYPNAFIETSGKPCRKNVWLGTSIATQADADANIPHLLACRDLSPVLFVSAEPLLGPIDLSRLDNGGGEHYDALRAEVITVGRNRFRTSDTSPINWVIAGGESGPNARPMHPDWARSIRDQCQEAGVPFLCKQGSGPKPGQQYNLPDDLFSVKEFPSAL